MTRKQKKTLIRIIVSVVLTGVAWAVDEIFGFEGWKALLLYIAPYLVIGYDVLWDAIRNIAHGQVFDEHFLMAIATVGAFGVGDYREASAVMIFYQVGELFQSIAVGKSRKSISALMDIRPDYAVVVRDGKEETVSPEEVELGETIVIKPGEKIPLDGEIIDGSTSVNTAALTGESLPADKTVGDRVTSGTINLSGVIHVRTQSRFEESTVAKILELVETPRRKGESRELHHPLLALVYSLRRHRRRCARDYTSACLNAHGHSQHMESLEQMDRARAYLPRRIVPMRAGRFRPAVILRRHRRSFA